MDRKGAPLWLWLCVAAALSGVSAADVFDAVLGDAGPCQRACGDRYGDRYGAQVAGDGHASENLTRGGGAEAAGGMEERERLTLACERGCRLFSICQFVDDGVDLNGTRYECLAACMEAYKRAEEQVACSTGCDSQQPLAVLRQKQLMSMVPRIHFLYPLTLVSSLCGNLMSSAQSFISSSWTFYLQADDGKVVVFQVRSAPPESQPELELEIPNLHLAFGGLMAASQQREKLDQDFLPRLQRVASSEEDVRQFAAEHEAKREERSNSGESSFQLLYEEHAKHDFLSCMSRRSGLPRWILAFTLILSIVVLLWLCCATTATAPDQYIRLPQKLSINGDLQYLKELYLKMPLDSTVPLVSVAMEDDGDEGGPLPAKVAMLHATL
ncbi:transmembrane protein 59 isoform X1 [Lampetra fluviatilis]